MIWRDLSNVPGARIQGTLITSRLTKFSAENVS
ncbi:hypothetical protein PHET_10301 [Paragonimus heterotremus]|uniref:Uncharacterized protein n=1 Tax=Paragonimus heterotremus TaxID=100268 RepID=A0A8J4T0H3_9TREM|nr:hypothetical protein PHET_10301 [Paragonimus heterotremus]